MTQRPNSSMRPITITPPVPDSEKERFTLNPEIVSIDQLRVFPNNPRTHSKRQIKKLAQSIGRLGIFNPILIDETCQILAGHARLEAARLMGLLNVPTLRFDHLTEGQKRAYVIADNKIAQDAGWDRELLAVEFQALIEIGFDLELTGFDTPEIDSIICEISDVEKEDDEGTEVLGPPYVCKPGDIFNLGKHRLICGDARDVETYISLLGEERASFIITDPPYNVKIEGNVSGLGKVRHKDFIVGSGELSAAQFTDFLHTVFVQLTRHSVAGSIHAIFSDWRHVGEMTSAGSVYSELKNICVWNKSNAGMGTFYRSKHEFVFIWKNGSAPHTNNFQLGQHGRNRTNVWDYPGANSPGAQAKKELGCHPTPKPVALLVDAIKDCSRRGEIVLDAFAGSGTIFTAAERTGRIARAIELDPKYCDVSIRRWQEFAGRDAIHALSGLTFEELRSASDEGKPND